MISMRLMFCVAVIALLSALPAALAQQASTSDKETFTLPEMVITAQKRTEKLEDVPVSASVVTPATLEKKQHFRCVRPQ